MIWLGIIILLIVAALGAPLIDLLPVLQDMIPKESSRAPGSGA